nr:hypothetical protein [Microbacterium bovistercoris]
MATPQHLEHGTPEGYDRGCRKDRDCPALYVHGMSCFTAHIRYISSERRYLELRARRLPSTVIAQRLGFLPEPRPIDHDDRSTMTSTPQPTPADAAAADAAAARRAAEQRRTPALADVEPFHRTRNLPKLLFSDLPPASRRDCRAWAQHAGHTTADKGALKNSIVKAWIAAGSPTPAQAAAPDPDPGTTPAVVVVDDDTPARVRARIRDWAHDVGVPCPDYGRIPARVIEAYEAGDPALGMPHPDEEARLARAEQTASDLEQVRVAAEANLEDDIDWEMAAANVDDAEQLRARPATEPFAELLDQVRDRIDMPRPDQPVDSNEIPRPDWGTVAESVDVERARSLAARLWDELELAEQRATTAENALALTLRKWQDVTDQLAIAKRMIQFQAEIRILVELRADIAEDRAGSAQRALDHERQWRRMATAPSSPTILDHADQQPRHAAKTPSPLASTLTALAAMFRGPRS